MSKPIVFFGAALAAIAWAAPASAEPRATGPRPEALDRVVQCRAIAHAAERLACFDREVAAMDAAVVAGELVAMDRQQVRRTRRSLFGLSLPSLGIFGDDSDQEEAFRIESRVRAASRNADGKWVLTLEDSARWVQTEGRGPSRDPRPGQPIRIRRASFGSYFANVNDQVAIRVRRIQ